jgi:O-antigen/teichoic acid export membrane protein
MSEQTEHVAWATRVRNRVMSDGSLTKRASLNAVVAVADLGGRMLVGLLVTPLLVTNLGAFLFGVWQVLQRLLANVAVATGRPGEALKWVLASKQSSVDYEDKRRQVGNALAVWFIFLPFLLLVGGLVSWFLPGWLHAPPDQVTTVRVASAVVVLNFIVLSLAYMPESVLHGENLAYKRLGLSTAVVLVGGVFTAVAVEAGGGLVGVAVALLMTTLLSGSVYLRIVRQQVPWFGIARPLKGAVRGFLGLSWWFMLWNFVMQMMRGADVILLGFAGSASLVTGYALTRFIPESLTVAAATLIFAVMPGLGGLIGAGEHRRAAEIRGETMTFTWLLVLATGSTIMVWERSFLGVWVGEKYYPGLTAMLLIVVMVLQLALIRTDSNIIDLTLKLPAKVLLGLGSVLLSVGLAWLLLGPYDLGIAGLVAGFVLGRLVLTFAYPLMIGRMLGVAVSAQVRGSVRPALVTVLMLAGAAYASERVAVGSWLTLAAASFVSLVVFSLFAFAVGLSAPRRRSLITRLRRVAQLT